jgi:hypothetical protein
MLKEDGMEKKTRHQLDYEMRTKIMDLFDQGQDSADVIKNLYPLVQDKISPGHFEDSVRAIRGHWTRNHRPRKD